MRILITGGNGIIGRVVTARFVARGWDVRVVDLEPTAAVGGVEYVQCDVTHYDDLRDAVRGCEAIVHLAAIPNPLTTAGYNVFRVNAVGTYNLFEAAVAGGIRRVVLASSTNVLGTAFGNTDIVAHYFPIDEDHPSHTTDPYAFSKQVVEEIAAYHWRRDCISSIALRLPWVWFGLPEHLEEASDRLQQDRALLDELVALPAHERDAQLREAREQALAYRARRRMEYPGYTSAEPYSEFRGKPLWRMYAVDRFDLWAMVHVQDVAQAFEKSVTADLEGSHSLFITAERNWLNYDTETLLRFFFPDVERRKKPLSGADALISTDRAKHLIGFELEYPLSVFSGDAV